MADITNRQLLEALSTQLGVITDQMVTKDDLKRELERFATKEDLDDVSTRVDTISGRLDSVSTRMVRLERKFDSYQAANVKHHLETRKMIADLDRRFTNLQEGLAQAVRAV